MPARFSGIQKTRRQLRRFQDTGLERAAQGTVDRSVQQLYKESQVEVPKKTGALAGTAVVIIHSSSGSERSSGIRYGQPGEGEGVIDYAAAVHEILGASHKSPTKAKFVEDPLVQNVPRYEKYGKFECRKQVRRIFR